MYSAHSKKLGNISGPASKGESSMLSIPALPRDLRESSRKENPHVQNSTVCSLAFGIKFPSNAEPHLLHVYGISQSELILSCFRWYGYTWNICIPDLSKTPLGESGCRASAVHIPNTCSSSIRQHLTTIWEHQTAWQTMSCARSVQQSIDKVTKTLLRVLVHDHYPTAVPMHRHCWNLQKSSAIFARIAI